jgi:hypothetical protein
LAQLCELTLEAQRLKLKAERLGDYLNPTTLLNSIVTLVVGQFEI